MSRTTIAAILFAILGIGVYLWSQMGGNPNLIEGTLQAEPSILSA